MSPRSLATIFSGTEENVTLRDGAALRVRVRQLPARAHIQFITLLADEAALIEFTCTHIPGEAELDANWADALSDESHLLLLNRSKELNFQRAIATVERANAMAAELKALAPKETSIT